MKKLLLRIVPGVFTLAVISGCADLQNEKAYASAEPVDPDAVTCKNVMKTGTRIGTRVCNTNRGWSQQSLDAREAAEEIQRKSLNRPMRDGGN